MTCPQSRMIWAVAACSQHNHILSCSSSLWPEHWSHPLITLVPPGSQFSAVLPCLMSHSHKKILFCVAGFILSLLRAARILLLCRIYMFFCLQSHFGLVFRLLQVDFPFCNYWALPKDRTHIWSVLTSICVAIFHSSRKLPALCKYFLELTSFLSPCYSCQLHWQRLFAEIWDWKWEVLSPHKSLFVLICILSCLTIDSAVSLLFFFPILQDICLQSCAL